MQVRMPEWSVGFATLKNLIRRPVSQPQMNSYPEGLYQLLARRDTDRCLSARLIRLTEVLEE